MLIKTTIDRERVYNTLWPIHDYLDALEPTVDVEHTLQIADNLRLLLGQLNLLASIPETRAILKELLQEILADESKNDNS